MDNSAEPDRDLLHRLNALKPTTVSLDPAAPSKYGNLTARRLTREDALAERLKSLRNQPETKPSPVTGSEVHRGLRQSSAPPLEAQPQAQPIPTGAEAGADIGVSKPATVPTTPSAASGNHDVDPLLDVDDQTLEELLADLGSDEQWLEEVAAEVALSKDEEHRKVTALLEEIGKAPLPDPDLDKATPAYHEDKFDRKDSDNEDDSDGEPMAREADGILAQAMDEVEWEKANRPQPPPKPMAPPVGERESDASRSQKKISEDSSSPLNLPTVPSDLQDQPGLPESSQQDAEFEAEIASRMAALKGLGSSGLTLPSAPTSDVDELGLPVAPTFAPGDRPVVGVYKRYGYTDEDAKTWCTVCLEDGTVRCFGCDDDIYCARCWKEMHVGPSAGYDERGHQWEKFVRDRR
jgi:hypothetical protein